MKTKNKILLLIFSGTGNTLKVGNMIATRFKKNGFSVDIIEIKHPFPVITDINQYRFIGFGYPIHAFNIPKIYRQFIATVPVAKAVPAFIFKTSGEPFSLNNASSYLLVKTLRKKGYQIRSDTHFLMPYNILFRYPDRAVKDMIFYAEILSAITVQKLIENKQDTLRYKFQHRLISALFRIQYWGAKLNGRLLGVNKNKCTQCGLCIKNCPTGNIVIRQGKIKFSGKCTMCMRCIMYCPQDAIKAGLLSRWKVNGQYNFKKIAADDTIKKDFFSEPQTGFFSYFRKYYDNLDKQKDDAKLRL